MNVGDERSRSLWMDIEVAPDTSKLAKDVDCDTIVVGSGIAGLSTAYELSGQGQHVVVLDRGKIGRGMTARTTAHLSANNDDTFKTMIDRRGEKLAKDFYVSQAASIDRIEEIQSSEKIECDFRRVDGFLFPGPQTEQSEIEEEYEASQTAGMPVEYAKGVPFKGYEKTRSYAIPTKQLSTHAISARPCLLHSAAAGPAVRRHRRGERGRRRRRCCREDGSRADNSRQERCDRHELAYQ